MTQEIGARRRTAVRCLALILGSAVLAWLLFVAGQYAQLVEQVNSPQTFGEAERVTIAQYFNVAAVVVLGLGALVAKRRLAPLAAVDADRRTLVGPVSGFAGLMLIVTAATAAWAVFLLFLGGFFGSTEGAAPEPVARIVNLYLPIVLYTALVLALILLGFVFSPPGAKHAVTEAGEPGAGGAGGADPAADTTVAAADTTVATVTAAPSTEADRGDGRRAIALAFATPIIAAAIALVLGLIVYDVTRTALEVWIWVVILVIIALGVLFGTRLARRGEDALGAHAPLVAGATILNFVLVVVFAVSAAGMSLGYAASAVWGLNVSPELAFSAYADDEEYSDDDESVELVNPQISLWGSDLKRGTEVALTLEPGAETVTAVAVDRNRWVSAETELPEGIAPGDYRLVASAETTDGRPLEASLRMTVTAGGSLVFPDGTASDDGKGDDEADMSRLLPVTAGWVFDDLLPAGLMLLLALALIAITLQTRNRPQRIETAMDGAEVRAAAGADETAD